jgi:hypothetical protein
LASSWTPWPSWRRSPLAAGAAPTPLCWRGCRRGKPEPPLAPRVAATRRRKKKNYPSRLDKPPRSQQRSSRASRRTGRLGRREAGARGSSGRIAKHSSRCMRHSGPSTDHLVWARRLTREGLTRHAGRQTLDIGNILFAGYIHLCIIAGAVVGAPYLQTF